MGECYVFKEASKKLFLLLRKAVLMRKHAYIYTLIQFLIAIIFTLQIRLIFEPQALRLKRHESARIGEILRRTPKDVKYQYSPNNQFVSDLMSEVSKLLNTKVTPVAGNKTHDRHSHVKSLWVIFTINEEENQKPTELEYKIRSYDFSNDLYAIWNEEEPMREDPYMASGFMPLQIAIDISFLEIWKSGELHNLRNKVWIGRFPYHTLNLLVMPVSLEPSVIIAYCLMVIALLSIPVEVLHKVVHDKKKGLRELMHVMGMSTSMLYTGWILYMLILAVPVATICGIILNPILVNAYAPTIFVFLLLYLLVSTCFMFFVGTLFRDSLKACFVSTLLWLLLSYLSTKLGEYVEDMSYSIKIATLCLPHNGLLYGLFEFAARHDMMQFDHENDGLSGNATNSRSNSADFYTANYTRMKASKEVSSLLDKKHNISPAVILISWILHVFFWMLLTLYFDKLRPGRLGAAKPWYYPCKRCAPRSLNMDINSSSATKWSNVERTPAGLTPLVTIRQITKTFGSRKNKIKAIDGMTIDFYEGEFHIILGHNGAGKSTLLKMIVGIYKPSRGNIYILGRDYNRQKNSQTNLIGYCPQDNILVNDLTAMEHVYLFAMLQGMSYKEAIEKAESMLTQLGLGINLNEKVKHFSLGMKRRVCLSMALIGNAKILVLDEPGYGVDPQNRRKVWDMLLAFREHRTIIMTTNSMEAADILPDRIAIIASGRVECYGSKMYLNRRFGVAYLLSIVIEEECDLDFLTSAIQHFSSDKIKLRSSLGSVIKYDLPRRTAFTRLLHHLEQNNHSLRIKSLGLSVTSIEEQFRRIGFMSHIRMRHGISAFYNDRDFEMMIRKRRQDLLITAKKWTRRNGQGLSTQQIGIMFYKKMLHISALWNIYGYTLLLTLIIFIVSLELVHTTSLRIMATRVNEVNISKYTEAGLGILLHSDSKSRRLLRALIETIPFSEKTSDYDVSNTISATELITMPTWNSMEMRERYFMAIDVKDLNKVNILYSVTASHSGPISMNFLHNALLKYNGCENCSIKIKTEPILDPTQWQSRIIHSRKIRNWQNFSLVVTLFLLLPSINLVSKEFKSSSKQLQLNTMGMSVMKYWLPIYFIDILIYLFCLLLMASLSLIFYNMASITNGIEFVQLLSIFLLYGTAALPIGYMLHFIVKRVEIISMILIMLNVIILIFINGVLTHPILLSIVPASAIQIGDILFHVFPQYVLACAVGNFLSIQIYNEQCRYLDSCSTSFWTEDPCCQACGNKGCYRPLSMIWTNRSTHSFHHPIMFDIAIFLLQTFVYITIIMFVESRRKRRFPRYFGKEIHLTEIDEPTMEPYVLLEKEHVDEYMKNRDSIETDSSDVMLSVQNLSKKFHGKTVVRGVNFNVYRTDCLGLLGMNGAGKSTIFKILSGEEFPTSGRAVIQNYDLLTEKHLFSSMIGYCPQIGGLNDFMTARQNLRLHATLRGIPLERVRDEVDKWLDVFDLLDYENIKVKYCPWGIQRKICILQSLIGDLPIVLLDEPTSGLDAIARQVVCDTLHFVREMDRSLLVTTQSMEEAETLCLRIGILVNGQFVAFGSSEQLKHQHGEYFTLSIGMPGAASSDKNEEVKKSVEEMFTGFDFKSLHAGILKYEINANATTYSAVFEKLEKLRIKHPEITDSSVSQTTMEHVFLSLCEKYQEMKTPKEIRRTACIRELINKVHRV